MTGVASIIIGQSKQWGKNCFNWIVLYWLQHINERQNEGCTEREESVDGEGNNTEPDEAPRDDKKVIIYPIIAPLLFVLSGKMNTREDNTICF